MKVSKTLALLGAIATLAVSAHAQRGQGGMRMGGRGGQQPAWRLLARNDVRDDLKVTDEQKEKLSAMQEEMMTAMRQRFQGGERPSPEEMQKIGEEMEKQVNEKLAAILTADQIKRLKEISIQMAGSAVVLRPEIAKELGITAEQKEKIQAIQQTLGQANGSVRQDDTLSNEEKRAKSKKNTDYANGEIEKLLTSEQKAKLKTMGGAPFERKDEQN